MRDSTRPWRTDSCDDLNKPILLKALSAPVRNRHLDEEGGKRGRLGLYQKSKEQP